MAEFDVLVDEAGTVWTAGSVELHAHHNTLGSRVDLSSYLVRNLGHARFRLSKQGSQAYVAFRPGELNKPTIFRVSELLIHSQCHRVTIEYVEDPPYLQHSSDFDDAIAILFDQDACPGRRRPQYFRQTLSLDRLGSEPRLAECAARFGHWQRSRGRVTAKSEGALLSAAADRHTTTRVHGSFTTFESLGRGYSQIIASGSSLEGKRVEDYPDRAYGRWVDDCTLNAAFHEKPVLEMIEVTIRMPDARPLRVRHERLLLPWHGRGSSYVSSTAAARVIFPSHSSV